MPSLADIINKRQGIKQQEFRVKMIPLTKLKPSKKNNYSVSEIRELADMIALSGSIQQNLVVRKIDADEYEVIAGHRRRLAAMMLVEDGLKQFEFVPCKEDTYEDTLAEFNLITTNSTQRVRSDAEKLIEVERLKEIIPRLTGDENIKGRALRKLIAGHLKMSETKVAQLDAINHNLIPEARERLESGELNVTVAYELSGLPTQQQKELTKKDVKVQDIKAVKKTIKSESITDTKIPTNIANDNICEGLTERKESENIPDFMNPPQTCGRRLKVSSENFKEISSGVKTFELLKDDDYKVGESIDLAESKNGNTTGRTIKVLIKYKLKNYTGLKDDYCILGLERKGENV